MPTPTLTVGDAIATCDDATAPFLAHPTFDVLVREFGMPPLGFPKECEYTWPGDAPPRRGRRISRGSFKAVG